MNTYLPVQGIGLRLIGLQTFFDKTEGRVRNIVQHVFSALCSRHTKTTSLTTFRLAGIDLKLGQILMPTHNVQHF